jgi:serine/threonine protein kinase
MSYKRNDSAKNGELNFRSDFLRTKGTHQVDVEAPCTVDTLCTLTFSLSLFCIFWATAVKKCREEVDKLLSPKQKERWQKEVEILVRLEHPNVIACVETPVALASLSNGGLSVLCMEYCSAGDLRQVRLFALITSKIKSSSFFKWKVPTVLCYELQMFYSLLCFPSTLNFSSHICQRQRQK